jgi:hypothetical protein
MNKEREKKKRKGKNKNKKKKQKKEKWGKKPSSRATWMWCESLSKMKGSNICLRSSGES